MHGTTSLKFTVKLLCFRQSLPLNHCVHVVCFVYTLFSQIWNEWRRACWECSILRKIKIPYDETDISAKKASDNSGISPNEKRLQTDGQLILG